MQLFRQSYGVASSNLQTGIPVGFNVSALVRPAIVTIAVASLLLFGLIRSVSLFTGADQQPVAAATATHLTSQTSSNPTSHPSPSATPLAANVPAKTVSAPATAPSCTPDTGYAGPSSLDLSGAAPGLTTSVDPIHYYQVNGYTTTQIRQQIINCAPKLSGDDDFTGYTGYRLSWQYNFVGNADGTCSLSAAKIGIRIGEVLPSWAVSANATPGLASKWSSFVTALDTHEHGHVALDEQYAAQITTRLQSLPATDCGTITQAASAIINSGVAALDAANVAYDTQTNHGATQGAILP